MELTNPARENLFDPGDLLRLLRRQYPTRPYNLTYLPSDRQSGSLRQSLSAVCPPEIEKNCATGECQRVWQASLDKALVSKSPQVHACPKNFLGFVVPLQQRGETVGFLLGGRLIEQAIPSPASASFIRDDFSADRKGIQGSSSICRSAFDETVRFVEEVSRDLPRLVEEQLHPLGLARLTKNLESLHLLTQAIADCPCEQDAVGMTVEALAVWYDVPRVLLRVGHSGQSNNLRAAMGFSREEITAVESALSAVFDSGFSAEHGFSQKAEGLLLHQLDYQSASLIPLRDGERLFGLAILLDADLHDRDRTLCDLMLDRLTSRMLQLRLEESRQQEKSHADRLLGMISELSMADSLQALYQRMLDMAVELCEVETGSLMLLDETKEELKITAVKGLSQPVAKSIAIPVGEGIAGRVLQHGQPLMVNDIEKDKRVAVPNRPRFRTKSFLCLPLKAGDRIVGVLNLADKSSSSSFMEKDLALLQSFLKPAGQMIERIAFLEKVGHLEKLSVTDPLTGLYNRRFLESRLDEEISRSQRQGQKFSLILADLDHFKIYNDVLGHLAGDRALQKVAGILRNAAREMDVVTRYGGEEFCLLLPGTGKKECLFVAERLRRAIEIEVFPGESHLPAESLTISLGVSAYPEDGRTLDSLLHAADLALYRAKHNGRNRLVLYQSDLSQILASTGQAE